jgi:hypothetical protein
MTSKTTLRLLTIGIFLVTLTQVTTAAADGFGAVVKLVEQFYRVKHQGVPLLARAGVKAATTAARIRGGEMKRLAEAGSVKVAIFEDQTFDSHGAIVDFKNSVASTLGTEWFPLVQTTAPKEEQQSYVFLRDAGQKFHVMVISIDKRDAAVVQVTLSPATLAKLMEDPDDMGRAITEDATTNDPE